MELIQTIAASDDWRQAIYPVQALLMLQAVDIAMGIIKAFKTKTLDSTIGWKGFTRKIATVLIIVTACVVDPLISWPLTRLAALFYCGWEGLSIVEKAGMIGLPVPPALLDALKKLREMGVITRKETSP